MKIQKWIAVLAGLLMLLSYPFYFLHFIDYQVAVAINNDKLITLILFIPFIIDAIILLACRDKDANRHRTYRVLYFSNLIIFSVFLVLYMLILFSSGGLNTKNFSWEIFTYYKGL